MARKLMMNNIENNVLSPVTDGLVCWFDGRDVKLGNVWNNRIQNGLNITIFNPFAKMITGASLYFDKSIADMYTRLNLSSLNLTNFTIDIFLKYNTSTNYSLGDWWTDGKNGAFYAFGSSSFNFASYFTTTSTSISGYILGNKTYRTLLHNETTTSVFVDGGELNTTVSRNSSDFLQQLGISNLNSEMQFFNGEIYSIKIYNRALTQEEIQQNYLYEQSITRT